MPGQIWRLKNPVETRRPFFLMSWISRLRFKKSGAHARPAVITPACGSSGSTALQHIEVAYRPMCRPCSSTTRLRRQYSPPVTTHHLDVCLHADCLAAGKNQTVRRARPLALRRAITLRPFLVLMRFRNPCSRLRLRFEGCLKVNDIAHSFSRDHFSMKRPHYRGVTEGCQSICHRVSAAK